MDKKEVRTLLEALQNAPTEEEHQKIIALLSEQFKDSEVFSFKIIIENNSKLGQL